MLKQRFFTAAAGLPILIGAVWFNSPFPFFTILAALYGIVASFEFYRLVKMDKLPLAYFGILWTLLFILSRDTRILEIIKPYFDTSLVAPMLLTFSITFSLVGLLVRRPREQAFNSWAWTMAGILYTGWLLSYMVAISTSTDGRNWVLLTLFATFASDTSAFFIGRKWGRRKLEPSISPAKTWEGSIAGVCGAIIVVFLFILPSPVQINLTWWQAAILGLLVSVFGQLGDLVESLFKRNMGVKDASRLLPGHGGLLDRMDSVVFAGVLVYYYMLWVVR